MKAADPEKPLLTRNEQEVLKRILEQAKLPDAQIARQLNLSQQAIFKIRSKLEQKGIIEGYVPVVNFRKIGIHVLAVLEVRVLPIVWERLGESFVEERIRSIPFVISAYRVPEAHITHLLVLGFKDIHQKDTVLMRLQTQFSNEVEIKAAYPLSVDRVIKSSPVGLLREVLERKAHSLERLFL